MDPLSGLTVACAVVQLLDFAGKTVKVYLEIRRSETGVSNRNGELEAYCHRTQHLCRTLDAQHLSTDPLGQLSSQCRATAQLMLDLIVEYPANSKSSPLSSLKAAVVSVGRVRTLRRIEERLKSYQSQLDSHILGSVRRNLETHAIDTAGALRNISSEFSSVARTILDSNNAVHDLLESEHQDLRRHVTDEINTLRLDGRTRAVQLLLLNSLKFPEMRARQEQVQPAYGNTFQWIFDDRRGGRENVVVGRIKVNEKTKTFAQWLQNDEKLFWISGKAGSGKSTLMNYIVDRDARLRDALCTWVGDHTLITAAHFFWTAGTGIQRSVSGLLRSVLHQILSQAPGLIPILIRSTDPILATAENLMHIPAWTETRLRDWLAQCLQCMRPQYKICLCIDGMDESSGDLDTLLNLILELRQNHHVKILVSSRPENTIEQCLNEVPRLKLHELTQQDIEDYITLKFEPIERIYGSPKGLKSQLQHRAQGVFLWVRLVVDLLLEGMRDCDSLEDLWQILSELPEDLDNLYASMLRKLGPVVKSKAAILLGLTDWHASYFKDVPRKFGNLLPLMFAYDDEVRNGRNKSSQLSCTSDDSEGTRQLTDYLRKRVHVFRTHVKVRSGGLLEIAPNFLYMDPDLEGANSEGPLETDHSFKANVEFIHRSARDFVQSSAHSRDALVIPTNDVLATMMLQGLSRLFDFGIRFVDNVNCVPPSVEDFIIDDWSLSSIALFNVCTMISIDIPKVTIKASIQLLDNMSQQLRLLSSDEAHWDRAEMLAIKAARAALNLPPLPFMEFLTYIGAAPYLRVRCLPKASPLAPAEKRYLIRFTMGFYMYRRTLAMSYVTNLCCWNKANEFLIHGLGDANIETRPLHTEVRRSRGPMSMKFSEPLTFWGYFLTHLMHHQLGRLTDENICSEKQICILEAVKMLLNEGSGPSRQTMVACCLEMTRMLESPPCSTHECIRRTIAIDVPAELVMLWKFGLCKGFQEFSQQLQTRTQDSPIPRINLLEVLEQSTDGSQRKYNFRSFTISETQSKRILMNSNRQQLLQNLQAGHVTEVRDDGPAFPLDQGSLDPRGYNSPAYQFLEWILAHCFPKEQHTIASDE